MNNVAELSIKIPSMFSHEKCMSQLNPIALANEGSEVVRKYREIELIIEYVDLEFFSQT